MTFKPEIGNVGFGSGLYQWGFTITDFTRKYADKIKVDPAKLYGMFWGDWYYNEKE